MGSFITAPASKGFELISSTDIGAVTSFDIVDLDDYFADYSALLFNIPIFYNSGVGNIAATARLSHDNGINFDTANYGYWFEMVSQSSSRTRTANTSASEIALHSGTVQTFDLDLTLTKLGNLSWKGEINNVANSVVGGGDFATAGYAQNANAVRILMTNAPSTCYLNIFGKRQTA